MLSSAGEGEFNALLGERLAWEGDLGLRFGNLKKPFSFLGFGSTAEGDSDRAVEASDMVD